MKTAVTANIFVDLAQNYMYTNNSIPWKQPWLSGCGDGLEPSEPGFNSQWYPLDRSVEDHSSGCQHADQFL